MARPRRTIYLLLLLLLALTTNQTASSQNDDHYCGSSFDEVMNDCPLPCPSGEDSECSAALGAEYVCFYFTGCADKIANGFVPVVPDADADASAPATKAKAPTARPTDVEAEAPTTTTKPAVVPASRPTASAVKTDSPATKPVSLTVSPAISEIQATTNAPTHKPTPRTKQQTLPPLSTVATSSPVPAVPNLTPTKPTITATPTSHCIKSIKTATRREINGNSPTTSTSYGYIFNLRTTPESPPLQILTIDFLTASTSRLNYELYSKEGSFAGYKGYYGRWTRIGKGSVVGKGLGEYTPIPAEEIASATVDGAGGARSLYFTLSTPDLMYRNAGAGSASDEVAQLSAEGLDLYEGESVRAFPFPLDGVEGAYAGPGRFLGAIRYGAAPCGAADAPPGPSGRASSPAPTASPVRASEATVAAAPSISEKPSSSPASPLTPASSYTPTTAAPVFTLSVSVSTEAPVGPQTTQVNILLTLRNTPDRNLTAVEEAAFEDELLRFFFRARDEARVDDVEVRNQRRVEWQDRETRELVPKVVEAKGLVSTAIALVLRVSHHGDYSDEEIGNALADLLQESQLKAFDSLWGSQEYPYFYWVDAIRSVVVDGVGEEAGEASVDVEDAEEELREGSASAAEEAKGGPSVGVIAWIAIGIPASFLLICGIGLSYCLLKKRHQAKDCSERTFKVEEDIETGLQTSDTDTHTFQISDQSNNMDLKPWNGARNFNRSSNEMDGSGSDGDQSDSSSDSEGSLHSAKNEEEASDKCSGDAGAVNTAAVIADTRTNENRSTSSSSSSDTSSDSDSSDSSEDSRLRAKIHQRRLQRRASQMAVKEGKSNKIGAAHIITSIEVDLTNPQDELQCTLDGAHDVPPSRKRREQSRSRRERRSASKSAKTEAKHLSHSDKSGAYHIDKSERQHSLSKLKTESKHFSNSERSGADHTGERERQNTTRRKRQHNSFQRSEKKSSSTGMKRFSGIDRVPCSETDRLKQSSKPENFFHSETDHNVSMVRSETDREVGIGHSDRENATKLKGSKTNSNFKQSHDVIEVTASSEVHESGRHSRRRKSVSASLRQPEDHVKRSSRHNRVDDVRKSKRHSAENLQRSTRGSKEDLRKPKRHSAESLNRQKKGSKEDLRKSSRHHHSDGHRKSKRQSSEDFHQS